MIPGRFVGSITDAEKGKGYDADVIINEDVWIASRVTILKGVTVVGVPLLLLELLSTRMCYHIPLLVESLHILLSLNGQYRKYWSMSRNCML